jgi:hypothetical protein
MSGLGVAAAADAAGELDPYGGLKAVRFEPSGFFRVGRSEGRWWFVTPQGSGFLSFGMNHPNKDYVRQPYNVEHWKREFGVDDPHSAEFVQAFAARAMEDRKKFGMNTLGCHALKPDFGRITVPYIQGLFWSKLTGKPLYHADTAFSVAYEQMPTPLGPVCADQAERAERFLGSATRSFSRPNVVGWNWCGWMDAWKQWRPEYQHSGLQDPFGRYHEPLPQTMKRFGEALYDYGLGSSGLR